MKSTDDIKVIEEFLKIMLVSAAKFNEKNVVSEICNLLLDEDHSSLNHLKGEKSLNARNILHFKDHDKKQAIYYANYNNQLLTALELLYVEKNIHRKNRNDAMRCLRKHAGYMELDQWMIDSYKLIHPAGKWPRRFLAFIMVLTQVLLSFLFLFWDNISDVLLCYQYMNIAFRIEGSTSNATCVIDGQKSTCFEQSSADIQESYTAAFCVMVVTILVSTMAYVWAAIKHSPGEWINKLRTGKHRIPIVSFISQSWDLVLWLLAKFMWPLTYVIRSFSDRVEVGKTGINHSLQESESIWKLLKSIENGLENFIQMFLQLYLLKPHVSYLTTMSFSQVIQQGIGSIFNYSDSICDGKNVNIALGKLFLSILSLSYGASSRLTSKKGITLGQTIKNLVIWIAFVCFSLSRTIAIFFLIALESPLLGIACFICLHLTLVPLVFTDITGNSSNFIEMVVRSSISMKEKPISTIRYAGSFMMSSLSSHTFIINFQSDERNNQTFWVQFKFQFIILVENLLLLLLPLMHPNLYPAEECFVYSSSFILYASALWMVGICLQVKVYFYFITYCLRFRIIQKERKKIVLRKRHCKKRNLKKSHCKTRHRKKNAIVKNAIIKNAIVK